MKNLFLTGACLLLGIALLADPETQKTTVHFDSDQHMLDQLARVILMEFVAQISLQGDCEFQIQGHTDHEGDNAYNQALSERRADAVKNFLESQGIETTLLNTEAFGKKQLLFKRYDDKSMRKNRRVDIIFKRFYFENTAELLRELARSTQNSFQIDASKPNTIICDGGSKVFIPKNGFVDSLGNPYRGVVNLEIIEALDYFDFLANELSTVSDGQLLQTGGMIKIEAFTERGEPLLLTDSSAVSVAINNSQSANLSDMFLFVSDSGNNWSPTPFAARNRKNVFDEDKPAMEYPLASLPVYKFKDDLPKIPLEPMYPIKPVPPRKTSYNRKPKWYEFLWRKSIALENQDRYQMALVSFEKKLNAYDRAVQRYKTDVENYPKRMAFYKCQMEEWSDKKKVQLEQFQDHDWKEAIRNYKLLSAEEQAKYADRFAVWDSIRTEKENAFNAMLANLGFPADVDPRYYLFENSKLGWINCDRFYKLPEESRTEIIARIPGSTGAETVFAILPRSKSMVQAYRNAHNQYKTPMLPLNEEVLIMAYRIEDGGIQIARSSSRRERTVTLEYEPIKVHEFRAFMKSLKV